MRSISINSLIYRNYLTSSLIPILTIEVVLLLLYFGINFYISGKNQQTLLNEATHSIQEIASREVTGINSQLEEVTRLALIMQREHEAFFASPEACYLPHGEPLLSVHENRALYKSKDNGGSVLYYSNTTPIGEAERHKARCSEMLDPLLKSIVDISPSVTQAYLNTWDDMNRLYPYMQDAPIQYGPSIRMADYNFYYEADAEHNPERKPAWTGAYLDPAGQGWMVSLIVPIYRGDFLEGVSGLDLTLSRFVQTILKLQFPWSAGSFMVDDAGTILAMQPQSESILGLRELGEHQYEESITTTIEKPEEYNLLKNPNKEIREQLADIFEKKQRFGSITINGIEYLISQEIVPQTQWRMMTLIERSQVLAPITELKQLSNNIGYLAIAVMFLFYLLFFIFLMKKTGKLTAEIANPIEELAVLTQGLGEHLKSHKIEPVGIREIDTLVRNYNEMARALEAHTDALNRAKLAAESANIAKSRFLATMSHEVRTPLNAVIGMAHMLSEMEADSDERHEFIDIIIHSGNELLGMLSNIIDYANIDTNSLTINTHNFSFGDLVSDYIKIIKQKAQEKKIAFAFTLDNEIPELITGDDKRIEQVLLNLGTNAVKFTDTGGSIQLDITHVKTDNDAEQLCFALRDTGKGITADEMNRLFNPFSQLDDSSSRKYGGAGLGLALSKQLVEMMGGRIWVTSEPGAGSTFYFTVPLFSDTNPHIHSNSITSVEHATEAGLEQRLEHNINREQLEPLLRKLSTHLADSSFEARKAMEEIHSLMGEELYATLMSCVDHAVAVYDFDNAQRELDDVLQHLSIQL